MQFPYHAGTQIRSGVLPSMVKRTAQYIVPVCELHHNTASTAVEGVALAPAPALLPSTHTTIHGVSRVILYCFHAPLEAV